MQRRLFVKAATVLPPYSLASDAHANIETETVEINVASLAQLEALSGLGTQLAARIVEARHQRPFTDWRDLHRRVKGLGPKLAARLSAAGLRVGGTEFKLGQSPVATPATADGTR